MAAKAKEVDSLSWWALTNKGDSALSLMARCKAAEMDNYERRARACLLGSLFEGCRLSSFNQVGYDLINKKVFEVVNTPIIRNTARSIVLTLLSKLFCIDAPLPMAMSDGGNWDQRAKAEDIDQFLECEFGLPQGTFNNSDDLWNHAGLLSMAAIGSCAAIITPGWDQVKMELDDTLNMGIDRSGKWGAIRTVVRTAWCDPEEMVFNNLRKYKQDILDSIETVEDPLEVVRLGRHQETRPWRQVKYHQGWRCKVNGRNGRYMHVLKNGTVLTDKVYKRTEWPGVIFHWERQLSGEWGTPVLQTIFEDVLRQNERLLDADAIASNVTALYLLGPKNIQADIGEGRAVTRITTDFPEKFVIKEVNRLDRAGLESAREHEQGAHNISGVSQSQTTATKAKGTGSGVHEELVQHLTSERFADQSRRLTQAKVVDTAKRFIWAAQDMVESGKKDFKRQWKSKDGKTFRTLTVKDLDFDDARYVLSIAPVSEDKNSPQTRAKKADEYLRLNLLTGPEWLQAQRDSDVTMAAKLAQQNTEWINKQIEKWTKEPLDKMADIYYSPTKWMDPKAAGKQVSSAMMQMQEAGCPQERLTWFQKFMDECEALRREEVKLAAQSGQALEGTTQQLRSSGANDTGKAA